MRSAANLGQLRRLCDEHGIALGQAFLAACADAIAADGDVAAAPGVVYERSLSRQSRRGGGIFYTPSPVVDAVVDAALAGLQREDPAVDLGGMRVADLACGGGVFLARTLVKLADKAKSDGVDHRAVVGSVLGAGTLGVDIDEVAANVTRLTLALAADSLGLAGVDVVRAVRVADSLFEPLGEGYDAIVGNPPWGQKQYQLTAAEKKRLRSVYHTAHGHLEPHNLFIERALQLLRPGGVVAFVLPDTILLKNQERVRRLLLEQTELLSISHIGRAFDGVNLDAVIIVARKNEPRDDHLVQIWHSLPENGESAHLDQRQSMYRQLPGAAFNIFLRAEAREIYQRVQRGRTIGDRFDIHEGVHSGNCRAKLFCDHRPAGGGVELVVGGAELSRYRLEWAGKWLATGDGVVDREAGDYANLGRRQWFRRNKLLVRRTGDRLVAAVDRYGYTVSNNMFVLLPVDGDAEDELDAYVALLNSSFMTWFFRTDQPRVGRLFAELKIRHLRRFPLPEYESWSAGVNELKTLGRLCAEGGGNAIEERIDDLVFHLYGLTAREVAPLLQ